MALREDLTAAKALIENPEDWCKGITHGQNCAMWAVSNITNPFGQIHTPRWAAASAALSRHVPVKFRCGDMGHLVVAYNDDPDTTHADIMALFDRAIASAEKST